MSSLILCLHSCCLRCALLEEGLEASGASNESEEGEDTGEEDSDEDGDELEDSDNEELIFSTGLAPLIFKSCNIRWFCCRLTIKEKLF